MRCILQLHAREPHPIQILNFPPALMVVHGGGGGGGVEAGF